MLANIALLALSALSVPETRYPAPVIYRPRIELWTNRGDGAVYTRGERVRMFFKLDRDAFVTIFRVDTDGRVRVLFPREPWEDNFARGGRELEVDSRALGGDAFTIDDYPGVGYLFAVASADPFVYDGIESGDHWDYRVIADGRVRGDPYVALTDLAQRIVPEGYTDWDYDIVSYNVDRHYDYPRFLCYDCHTYVSWPTWNPYYNSCVRFRIVVYDDPWYYPYRYYGGSRVVVVRPYRPQPRFIFKDWGANRPSRDGFVSRERERPVNDDTRRGVTGRDIGGRGIIPPPNVRERRERPGQGSDPDRERPDRPDRPERPDRPDRPDNPNNPDRPDRPNRPDRPDRPNRPERPDHGRTQQPQILPRRDEPRAEPRREQPRAEPRAEPRREQPRAEPRAEPRREQPRAEPRSEPRRVEPRSQPAPRAEPRRDAPKAKPQNEPEVRRRKP